MPLNLSTNSNIRLRPLKLIAILLFIPSIFFGQKLTGLWSGVITNDSNTVRQDVSLEIALTEYRGKVYGYSCSEFIVNDTLYYIVKRVKGTINGDECEVKDDEIISYNFHGKLDKGVKVIHTFRMNKQDSTWSLAGGWKTTSTKKYYSLSGKTELKEEKDLANSKLFPHLEELSLADDVAFYKEQKRMKETAIQTSSTETDVAKNLFLTKPDIDAKNKSSLTSLENHEEKKNETVEENIIIQQRKVDGSVATIPSETKKTSLSSINTVETKKPIVIDSGKPRPDDSVGRAFIEKKETTTVSPQIETKRNEISSSTVQSDTKKIVPPVNNPIDEKKNESINTTNNTLVQKNTTIDKPIEIAPKKTQNPTTIVQSDNKKITASVSGPTDTKKNEVVSSVPVQTTVKKNETPVTTNNSETNKSVTNTISETPKINSSINSISDNKKPDPVLSTAATFAAERKSEKMRDRKSTRLNSSHSDRSRMPSSA